MELSFAPMEGITSCIFRETHAALFGGADRYYTPFIAPDGAGRFKTGCLRDALPENNPGIPLIPQILCNRAEPFLLAARQLGELGYEELNLNAGCPSGTVTAKHKGAGMLADPESLDNCLADIFSRCEQKISVKTRLGVKTPEEFAAIAEIYRKYPLSRLIIHARTAAGKYESIPDTSIFAGYAGSFPFPVSYNGNIFSSADAEALHKAAPGDWGLMLGRGAVADPALFRKLRGGAALKKEELQDFHNTLLRKFIQWGLDERSTMARLKELWFYWKSHFPHSEKELKALFKSRSLSDYSAAAEAVFQGEFSGDVMFT